MNRKLLKLTILSFSMLTVMAGAAVAPAISTISLNFSQVDPGLIKMILTLPGLFIMGTNLVFPFLSRKANVKVIALVGLLLYTVGGTLGGFSTNIWTLLLTRAFLGIGVGLIMPLSTGLLAYYFEAGEQKKLMGYSAAMNNLGGILAMIFSGYLSSISWNYSFYVYLLGFVVILPVLFFFPKDRVERGEEKIDGRLFKSIAVPFFTIFFSMMAFYAYVTNFSLQAVRDGILTQNQVGLVMAFQSIGAFFLALAFGKISKKLGKWVPYVGLGFFTLVFLLLIFFEQAVIYGLASSFLGFAMGLLIPYINASAVSNIDKKMATTVMSLMSIALYLGQFLSPFLSGILMKVLHIDYVRFPYIFALVVIMIVSVLTFRKKG